MVRPIDAYALNNALVSWYNDTVDRKEKSILRRVMQMVVHAPISGMGVGYNLYRRPPEGADAHPD